MLLTGLDDEWAHDGDGDGHDDDEEDDGNCRGPEATIVELSSSPSEPPPAAPLSTCVLFIKPGPDHVNFPFARAQELAKVVCVCE